MNTRGSILVIDDEPGLRDLLAYELGQHGFEIETAASGMAAVEAMRHRKFDVAVTDFRMPGMNGAETVAALRSMDPDIEVIVATGYASVGTAVECMKRGAYDFIQKPYDLEELRLLLERAMQHGRLQGVIALYEASRALVSTLGHGDLVRLVAGLAERVLGADGLGLVLSAARKPASIHALPEVAPPSTGLLGALAEQALRSKRPLRFPSPEEGPLPDRAVAEGFASALVYPLLVREHSLGALVVLRRASSPAFSPSEMPRAAVFASQLSLALDNAAAYAQLAEQVDELVRTRDQLIQAEKCALAGRLAGCVAHEINTPLTYVLANLEALQDYSTTVGSLWLAAKAAASFLLTQPAPAAADLARGVLEVGGSTGDTEAVIHQVAEVVEETLEGVRRIADLVSGFNHLGEPGVPAESEQAPVDLRAVLLGLLEAVGLARSAVEVELAADCVVRGAPADLRASLANLLAFVAPGRLSVSPEAHPLRVSLVRDRGNPTLVLTAPDLHLTDDELASLFEPRIATSGGARTMRVDLALALAGLLLRRNGAHLTAQRAPGGGLSLRVEFSTGVEG
jgi:CheY-like chemotaxis protein